MRTGSIAADRAEAPIVLDDASPAGSARAPFPPGADTPVPAVPEYLLPSVLLRRAVKRGVAAVAAARGMSVVHPIDMYERDGVLDVHQRIARALCEGMEPVLDKDRTVVATVAQTDEFQARVWDAVRGAPIPEALAKALRDVLANDAHHRIPAHFAACLGAVGLDAARVAAIGFLGETLSLDLDEVRMAAASPIAAKRPSFPTGFVTVSPELQVDADGTVRLRSELPASVLDAAPGLPLAAIVSHPVLDRFALVVETAARDDQHQRTVLAVTGSDLLAYSDLADRIAPADRPADAEPQADQEAA